MCGIVGVISSESCVKDVIEGLRSLEYRGYDSAGIAILNGNKIVEKNLLAELQN